jgi:hypothetical protein
MPITFFKFNTLLKIILCNYTACFADLAKLNLDIFCNGSLVLGSNATAASQMDKNDEK